MQVGWTEVMAPFGDAMGFIDSDAGELILVVDCLEVAAEGLCEAEFRSDVEEPGTWMTTAEVF